MRHLILLLIWFLFPVVTWAQADIIPQGQRSIYIQAHLTNLADYPKIVFIHLETFGNQIRRKEVIASHGRINKGYKFNRLEILAIPRTDLKRAGGIEKLDVFNDPAILRGLNPIKCGVKLVPISSPLAGKDVYYRIEVTPTGLNFHETHKQQYREGPNHPGINLFAWAFFITLMVEGICFFILVKWVLGPPKPQLLRAILSLISAQVLTLPLLWFLITHFHLMGTGIILAGESFAVVAESLVYRFGARLPWKAAMGTALACNLISYAVGYLV
ncbi:MAG: hypothetical protein MI747_23910 [Desulfobacterales bacterium]|nr:hypothetical protein [Desulfobacterales bacterium]